MRFQLYSGLVRDKKWYNFAEIERLQGGSLTLLKGGDKTGAARILNLLKGSLKKLYTENDEEYELTEKDYRDIKTIDTWKIGYEQIKLFTGEKYPVFEENFLCTTCSRPGREFYTKVNESWEKLIEEGFVVEHFQQEPDEKITVKLPKPFVVEGERTVVGGTFDEIVLSPMTVGDMLQIHHDTNSMKDDASEVYAIWDVSIVEVKGMNPRDLVLLKRMPDKFFSETYLNDPENQQAIIDKFENMRLGFDAVGRRISCRNCGEEVGRRLDFTNFFSPLLEKSSFRGN